ASLVEQFDVAAGKLVTALRAAGGEPDQLVSLVVYTTDIDEYRASTRELGEVWRRHLGRRYPAMALIGVSALLEPDTPVEMIGVAVCQSCVPRERLPARTPGFRPDRGDGRAGPAEPSAPAGARGARPARARVRRLCGRALRAPRGPRARLHRGRDGARAPGA